MDCGKKGYMRVAGWYLVDVKFPEMENKLDSIIHDTIINCGAALPHANRPEETKALLDILLSNAQELYRRAQEQASTTDGVVKHHPM